MMQVLAYDRGETLLFPCLEDCAAAYGFSDKYALVRAVMLGTTAPSDGFTTFDYPPDVNDDRIKSIERTAQRSYRNRTDKMHKINNWRNERC